MNNSRLYTSNNDGADMSILDDSLQLNRVISKGSDNSKRDALNTSDSMVLGMNELEFRNNLHDKDTIELYGGRAS